MKWNVTKTAAVMAAAAAVIAMTACGSQFKASPDIRHRASRIWKSWKKRKRKPFSRRSTKSMMWK